MRAACGAFAVPIQNSSRSNLLLLPLLLLLLLLLLLQAAHPKPEQHSEAGRGAQADCFVHLPGAQAQHNALLLLLLLQAAHPQPDQHLEAGRRAQAAQGIRLPQVPRTFHPGGLCVCNRTLFYVMLLPVVVVVVDVAHVPLLGARYVLAVAAAALLTLCPTLCPC
jgi:hypothetical protein